MAILEGLVIAWGAQKFYQAWSRLYCFVTVRLPWFTRNGVETEGQVEAEREVDSKRAPRHRQAAIDARNDYKTVCCCN